MTGDGSILALIFGECHCTGFWECDLGIDVHGGIVLWIMLMIYMFKALGTICDEYFVPALEVIVEKLDISNDVAGATFMASGSSAPELFTAFVSTFLIVSEGGVGTIIGSAIFNIFAIVGITGFVACRQQSLKIWWYPLARDSTFYVIAILELLVVLWNEVVEWYEGLIMVLTYLVYTIYMKYNAHIVRALGIETSDEVVTFSNEESVQKEPENTNVVPLGATLDSLPTVETPTSKVDSAQDTSHGSRGAVLTRGVSNVTASSVQSHSSVKWSMHELRSERRSPSSGPKSSSSEVTPRQHGEGPSRLGSSNGHSGSRLGETVRRASTNASNISKGSVKWSMSELRSETKSTRSMSTIGRKATGSLDLLHETTEVVESGGWLRYVRDPLDVFWELTLPTPEKHCWILFFLAIFYIGVCTFLMVDATSRVGCILRIPPFVMGCTLLAAGTSIPDALGSIAVARQGEGDMAIANALGSNVFDILLGLGLPWMIARLAGKEVQFPGAKGELTRGIFILIAVLIVFVGSLLLNRWQLTRIMGSVLMSFYMCYVVYNVILVAAGLE
mmetsp:Transcript_58162/g.125723  ORF Transcript_58162/g.125723 Transcript_58162/m.125723 type:complete len:560 (-) Transcript_58162:234-1913(-)|eukprot:CAMPEP_0170586894 /NCGR_PEP_ID=MMETSP0224-20130122/9988_1 /TAXON_ID=285029 /ORGANISM="Togula jolla, Strain CCCM 725" /LENGTH=559 /DNA_ID=CAMNT_0010910471 /DNA_START=53 /DNA_END=1732 /DNA_ORIENTATION=+